MLLKVACVTQHDLVMLDSHCLAQFRSVIRKELFCAKEHDRSGKACQKCLINYAD